MTIKYRIGIMPGPWSPGREGVDFLWRLCILRPLCPPERVLDQLARVDEEIAPEYHRR
jgi:hypothetical protein